MSSATTRTRLSEYEQRLECKKTYFNALRDHFLTSKKFTLEEAWNAMPHFAANFNTYPVLMSLLDEMVTEFVLEGYTNGPERFYRF